MGRRDNTNNNINNSTVVDNNIKSFNKKNPDLIEDVALDQQNQLYNKVDKVVKESDKEVTFKKDNSIEEEDNRDAKWGTTNRCTIFTPQIHELFHPIYVFLFLFLFYIQLLTITA